MVVSSTHRLETAMKYWLIHFIVPMETYVAGIPLYRNTLERSNDPLYRHTYYSFTNVMHFNDKSIQEINRAAGSDP